MAQAVQNAAGSDENLDLNKIDVYDPQVWERIFSLPESQLVEAFLSTGYWTNRRIFYSKAFFDTLWMAGNKMEAILKIISETGEGELDSEIADLRNLVNYVTRLLNGETDLDCDVKMVFSDWLWVLTLPGGFKRLSRLLTEATEKEFRYAHETGLLKAYVEYRAKELERILDGLDCKPQA